MGSVGYEDSSQIESHCCREGVGSMSPWVQPRAEGDNGRGTGGNSGKQEVPAAPQEEDKTLYRHRQDRRDERWDT